MTFRFGNMVRETSTTTGTGTYDLAGPSSGYAGFVAATADGAVVTYRAQMSDDWEIGIGTITDAATDTLARTEVLETLVSGSYTGSGASAVNWGAGTKTIDLIGPAQAMKANTGFFLPHPGQQISGRYYATTNFSTARTFTANVQYFSPHYHALYAKISILMTISTAQASTNVDIGLYSFSAGQPATRLEQWTANSLASTGDIVVTTAGKYKPGWYWLSYLTDATTAAARGGTNSAPDTTMFWTGKDALTNNNNNIFRVIRMQYRN